MCVGTARPVLLVAHQKIFLLQTGFFEEEQAIVESVETIEAEIAALEQEKIDLEAVCRDSKPPNPFYKGMFFVIFEQPINVLFSS